MDRRTYAGLLAILLILTPAIYSVVGAQHPGLPFASAAVMAAPGSIGSGEPVSLNTYAPEAIPLSADELVNPLRGLYRWRSQEVAPQPRPAYDAYSRYEWRDLEPERGTYDFSAIDRDLAQAAEEGRKFSFRIRAMVDGKGQQVPDYLVGLMEKGWSAQETYIPDWNDPDFIARADALIRALGERYDGDSRLGWIDIGFYGNWGEWHMWPFEYPSSTGAEDMTVANLKALVDMHLRAFSATPVVMMTEEEEVLIYALKLSPRIGWRRDSLGSSMFTENSSMRRLRRDPEAWDLFVNRWKTAPVITEFINPNDQSDPVVYELARQQAAEFHVSMVSNGNTLDWGRLSSTGRASFIQLGKELGYRYELDTLTLPTALRPGFRFPLEMNWENVGNAPAYEHWQVTLQLRQPGNATPVWEWRTSTDLRQILPTAGTGPVAVSDSLLAPASLPAGTYDLHLVVTDPKGYRAPMALAIEGAFGDGSYLLGQIQVQTVVALQGEVPQLYLPLVVR